MNKKILIDVIGLELIALVVLVGYKLSPVLLPKADVTVFPDPICNLQHEACAVTIPSGGTVTLSLGTRPVPLIKPFNVEVVTTGFTPTRVEVDFAGIDMNMGMNRAELVPTVPGRYVGEITLPVCITGWMDWQATVLVDTSAGQILIPYRLTSGERH